MLDLIFLYYQKKLYPCIVRYDIFPVQHFLSSPRALLSSVMQCVYIKGTYGFIWCSKSNKTKYIWPR